MARPDELERRRDPRRRTIWALRLGLRLIWWGLTLQLPRRLRAWRHGRRSRRPYADWVRAYDTLDGHDLERMRALAASLEYRPLASIVMPVFNPPERFLREALDSILAQAYENWELCVADDASSAPHVRRVLEEYARRDTRIRISYRNVRGGISAASNTALEAARGELVGLFDHDDVLRAHALLLMVRAFDERPELRIVYSDEDKIDADGKRFDHYFKPDWNPALLLSQNYMSHFSVFRTELVRGLGGFRSEFDGSQDWDLFLRLTRGLGPEAIGHIPHVLYHWRAHRGSAAATTDAKPEAIDAGRRAIVDHLERIGAGAVVRTVKGGHQSVRYTVSNRPRVSAVVPSTGSPNLAGRAVAALLERTDYEALELILAVSETAREEPSRKAFLEDAERDRRIRVLTYSGREFNYAWVNNWAAAHSTADLLLFLNDDIDVVHDDWLEIMVGHAVQPRVGAVGALLLYPNDTIQHAGVMLGAGAHGIADHLYRHRRPWSGGYQNRLNLVQDLSAVTGACMLVSRKAFNELGGLDETFAVAYNDVELCLRLRRSGRRVVFTPDAVLSHDESASFGSHGGGRADEYSNEVATIRLRWGSELDDDPMHNPNLERDSSRPERLAFPPRVSYAFRRRDPEADGIRSVRADAVPL